MSFFASNIKLLRKRRGRTQDDVAFLLDMKRPTLSGYENEVAQPGLEALVAFSKYYNVSIDTLVKVDLSQLSESQLSQLERGYDIFVTGSKLRVLATTVDSQNEENIEMVSEKAKAGYRTGFADPEFIKVLPTFQMPFLSKQKKYRSFQVSGDSMLPIPEGSWVTCEFVQNWNLVRDRHAYVIHTLNDGVVFKVVENLIKTEGKLRLHSLNPIYEPYEVHVNDIREVWKFVNFISSQIPEANSPVDQLSNQFSQLKKEVESIKSKLKNQNPLQGKTGNLFED
ncbi:MAG: helix-turn-helix domain-containing protein [Bacteroidales bacterium]|jgi:transcriptional regulator with XRE-family HTH domain|nr:helix-turn-helix domain-containing protein [Bacteroidales bacterium]NLM91999.1 helix-turn-helix domain-containing protein [Bacteroidales bacterium]